MSAAELQTPCSDPYRCNSTVSFAMRTQFRGMPVQVSMFPRIFNLGSLVFQDDVLGMTTCAAVHHSWSGFLHLHLLHSAHQVSQGLRCRGNAMVRPGMVVEVHHLAWLPCAVKAAYLVSSPFTHYTQIAALGH